MRRASPTSTVFGRRFGSRWRWCVSQREGVDGQRRQRFVQQPLQSQARAGDRSGKRRIGQAGIVAGFVVGVLLFMSIIIHGQNILRGVLEEKIESRRRSRDLERQTRDAARRQGARRWRGGTDAAGRVDRHRRVSLHVHHARLCSRGLPIASAAATAPRGASIRSRGRSADCRSMSFVVALAYLPRRLHVLRRAVRRGGLDGEQRAGSAAGGSAGDAAHHERVAHGESR